MEALFWAEMNDVPEGADDGLLWKCTLIVRLCTKHDGTLSFQQIDYIVEAFLFLVANPDCVVVNTS